jgi:predicted metal-dependent phosphoesterase TrpH
MRSTPARTMRADLHVHSWHSGYSSHLRFLRARECYSDPEAVYATAKARGMDLVTITDHDSIDGCLEFLSHHPDANDFFVSEEIECLVPNAGFKVHIAAYNIDERIHRDVQPLRGNVFEVADYLRSRSIFYALNHPFFFFKGQIPLDAYLDFALQSFPAVEVRNGTMLAAQNELADAIVRHAAQSGVDRTAIGGSDSHTLRGVGTTYTEAPGRTPEEFLHNLAAGHARPGGVHGSTWREAREIYGVVARYWTTLAGFGRQDLSWQRRLLGIAFSTVSLPFEFSPLLIASLHKRDETRRVEAYREEWEQGARRGVRNARSTDFQLASDLANPYP